MGGDRVHEDAYFATKPVLSCVINHTFKTSLWSDFLVFHGNAVSNPRPT